MDEIDDRTKRALFRLEVIGPLVAARLSKDAVQAARKQILERVYVWPDGTERRVAERTLRSWVKRHKEKGFAGLFDVHPGTFGVCRAISPKVLSAAVELRKDESSLSIPQIMDLLKHVEGLKEGQVENICAATLNRHLHRRGARKNKPSQQDGSFQRWEQRFVNDMWIGDTADGIWIPDPSSVSTREYS